MKTFTVVGNDRASASTGHGETFSIEVPANNPAQALTAARRVRQKAGRHHILIGTATEKPS